MNLQEKDIKKVFYLFHFLKQIFQYKKYLFYWIIYYILLVSGWTKKVHLAYSDDFF